jgi:hypothetical protein
MSGILTVPRAAFLLAGVAAGALTRVFKSADDAQLRALKKSVAALETRLASQETLDEKRVAQIEARLNEHDERLQQVPTTSQLVAAMESLLSKTMAGLDERLTSQAHSIEVLKATVAQTDELLERVLESLDSIRQDSAQDESVLVP